MDQSENNAEGNDQMAEKEKLIRELTDMGFSISLVQEIVDNAGDVPKDLIVEQLLTSNYDPVDPVAFDSVGPVDAIIDLGNGSDQQEDLTVPYKMVIVMNTGLNMGIGKIASQAAHAALGLYELIIESHKDVISNLRIWNKQGSRKIVVGAKDSTELTKLCEAGSSCSLPYFCVIDAGLTEVEPESFTALAFFGSDDQLNPVTGKLRLLK